MLAELGQVTASALAARALRCLREACEALELVDVQGRALDALEAMSTALPDEETKAVSYIMGRRMWEIIYDDERGLEDMAELVERTLAASADRDSLTRARILLWLGLVRWMQGQAQAGVACGLESLDLIGSPEADIAWFEAAGVVVQYLELAGRWDEALALARRCQEPHPYRAAHNSAVAVEFFIGHRRGEAVPLDDLERRLVPTQPTPQLGTVSGWTTRFFPEIFGAFTVGSAEPGRARTLLQDFLKADDVSEHECGFDTLVLAARLAWMTPPAGGDYVEMTRSAVTQTVGGSVVEACLEPVTDAHLIRARGEESSATWWAAVRAVDGQGWPFHRAQCRLHLAEVLIVEGDRDGAAVELGVALTIAEQLQARPLADEIRSLAARARLSLPGHAQVASSGSGLTARELEVLQLLVGGATNPPQAVAESFAFEAVDHLVLETMRRGARRRECSLASKVLHWLMPWRIPVFDSFVRSEVGVPDSWDLPDAYRAVCRAVFARVREIAGANTTWMGSSDPQSLLHALDKWLWWTGGGDQGTAVVVTDPERLIRRLGLLP